MRLELVLRQRRGLLPLQEGTRDIFYTGLGLPCAALTTVSAGRIQQGFVLSLYYLSPPITYFDHALHDRSRHVEAPCQAGLMDGHYPLRSEFPDETRMMLDQRDRDGCWIHPRF